MRRPSLDRAPSAAGPRARRRRWTGLAVALLVPLSALAAAGLVVASPTGQTTRTQPSTVSPKQLVDAGWLCVDVPDNWVHCVPPGIDLEPPDVSESMINLNFYTHDPNAAEARFLGVETLIRADIWDALPEKWPCQGRQGEYHLVPAEALPPYGYMYCHHFKAPERPAPPLD